MSPRCASRNGFGGLCGLVSSEPLPPPSSRLGEIKRTVSLARCSAARDGHRRRVCPAGCAVARPGWQLLVSDITPQGPACSTASHT